VVVRFSEITTPLNTIWLNTLPVQNEFTLNALQSPSEFNPLYFANAQAGVFQPDGTK
jgi:hypothetical protein